MRELEERIAAWRRDMMGVLPGQPDAIRELEEHLREHIDARLRTGATIEVAFADAVRRLGDVGAIAEEFRRVSPRWFSAPWPVVLVQGTGYK